MKEPAKKITPEEARVLAAYRVIAKIAIRRAQPLLIGLDTKGFNLTKNNSIKTREFK